jgi:hypothetical protein
VSKFTPGPWRAAIGKDWPHRAVEHPVEIACLPHEHFDALDIFGVRDDYSSHESFIATAHLIAAAPDLYAALENALFALDRLIDPNDAMTKGLAALARARGEQQTK